MSKQKFNVGDKVYTLFEYGVPTTGVVLEVFEPIMSEDGEAEIDGWSYSIKGIDKKYPFEVSTSGEDFYKDVDEFVSETTKGLKAFAKKIKGGDISCVEDMAIEEAYLNVSIAVSEAQEEYLGRNLNQGTEDKLEDWDKALEIIGKELGITEEKK